MSWLRMYVLLVRASVRSRMQYRFNFWFSVMMAAVINAVDFALLAVILLRFGGIKGWSLAEAGYLYGVLTAAKAIYRSLASDVHHLERYLVSGDLDALLLRPVPVLLALMSQNFHLRVGELLLGGGILALSLHSLLEADQVTWSILPWTLLVIGSGSVLLFAIGLLTASAGFWITRIETLQNITEDAARTAAQYPLTIYPSWLKILFIGVIPIAFANYLPALYLLRHETGWWMPLLAACVALLLLAIAVKVWRIGISRYQSTGS
ncbi:ABC transporter permease [Paenibacillus beijingensis]|uniref:ABC transporter permease n=1 Tax=Paenibacillus beijingensis TaxID=1126833 RepID=A0A0D5NKQ5_9BACL|nr:ABC-2 family transporter protein [Paenibacillus beijingensis]AJY75513.1 hypothetical protein VN24_14255 [Paenibacillus beijingensis]